MTDQTDQTTLDDKNSIDFERLKDELHESDFDGHTAFQSMTFTQKLAWLSEAVVSTYLLARDNPNAGCNAFFNKFLATEATEDTEKR
jgi:hypothetical protein